MSAIAEQDGIRKPNRYGFTPFLNMDVLNPDPEYFKLLEFLLEQAERRDITVVLLPTWGDKFNQKWGEGPEIFDDVNAYEYGKYIAGVAGKYENLIWMLGGDRPLENENHYKIIFAMAQGIKKWKNIPI